MNVELNIHGVKCDNPNCDYSDMSVTVSDYADWVNKPCPKCGENLMTQKDYDNTMVWVQAAEIANSYSPEEWKIINESLTSDEIDAGLDFINEQGLRKTGTDSEGNEIWERK